MTENNGVLSVKRAISTAWADCTHRYTDMIPILVNYFSAFIPPQLQS